MAERFCRDRGMGWLSMDIVRSVARSVSPELARVDVGVGSDPRVEAEAMRSTFELVTRMSSRLADSYLLEGVGFMPNAVAGLPNSIDRRACFVGMSSVTLEDIDTHAGLNDWHRGLPEDDAARLSEWIVDWSQLIERDCQELGMPYVDLAGDWSAGAARVAAILDGASATD